MTQDEFQNLVLQKFDSIDKFQSLVLQKFDSIDQKFESIDKKFEAIDSRFDAIDKKFETIDTRFDAIDKKFETIDTRFDAVEQDLKTVKSDVQGIKTQQEEHGQLLQALLHNQEVANARLEGLELSKATVSAIDKLATKDDLKACMKLMNNRMFEQELEVEKLKLVK